MQYPVQVRDAGNLLTRAGLTLPAVDVDDITMRYPSGKGRRDLGNLQHMFACVGLTERSTTLVWSLISLFWDLGVLGIPVFIYSRVLCYFYSSIENAVLRLFCQVKQPLRNKKHH